MPAGVSTSRTQPQSSLTRRRNTILTKVRMRDVITYYNIWGFNTGPSWIITAMNHKPMLAIILTLSLPTCSITKRSYKVVHSSVSEVGI